MFDNELFVKRIELGEGIPDNNYIRNLPVVKSLNKNAVSFKRPVTFFVGENGVGKSTLIEAIAVAMGFNPEGGSINFNFSTRSSHSDLHRYLRIAKGLKDRKDGFFLRAESFFNVASNIEELDEGPMGPPIIDSYGGVSLHEQSHGESFMSLIENRFSGNSLFILDEPEAALSPMRLMRLICNIDRLVKEGSQFIISTHSPILISFPGSDVYEITENGMNLIRYFDTEIFSVTKSFLNNPEGIMKLLLK